jgi:hypothetical protein
MPAVRQGGHLHPSTQLTWSPVHQQRQVHVFTLHGDFGAVKIRLRLVGADLPATAATRDVLMGAVTS